jgi:surface polysaccharide O-acyltransferase-like enzyme
MALGYSLRFPVWPLLTGSLTATDWQELVKVDVLQTLAFSGLILVAVERWIQSLPWRVLIIVALAIAFVVGQSAAEGWRTGWLGVDAWLNRNTGSLFPLFPWVGFGLAGWLCGVGVQWGQRHVPGVWGGAVMVCLTAASGWLLPRLEGFTEPTAFFWQRLGWVLALGLGLCLATARLGSHGWVSKALSLAGRESLIMYVAHLWLIHAVPMLTLSLEQRWKSQLRLPEVVAMFIGLLSVSLALAYGQAWRKKRLTPTVTPPAPA